MMGGRGFGLEGPQRGMFSVKVTAMVTAMVAVMVTAMVTGMATLMSRFQ